MILTHDDVRDIVKLLDASDYDEIEIETPRFKLTLRRAGAGWTQETKTKSPAADGLSTKSAAKKRAAGTPAPGMVAVTAPLIGTFYRAPKPGAEPFVSVGSKVNKDTVIGIIETMKLMNSVAAGANGTIAEICAENGEFVEHGEMLMTLKPE